MLRNLDGIGEQAINRIATAALASQMQEAESFDVNVKVDPQELSQGTVSAFTMEGKNVVTAQGFRATHFSLMIEDISVYPFKALMGNIKLRSPATGTALLGISPADLEDALFRNLRDSSQTLSLDRLNCQFTTSNQIRIVAVVTGKEIVLDLAVGFDVNQKMIAFQSVNVSVEDEQFSEFVEALQHQLLELLNLNSLVISGLEFTAQSLRVSEEKLELMAIAKITSFPKAI